MRVSDRKTEEMKCGGGMKTAKKKKLLAGGGMCTKCAKSKKRIAGILKNK